ncbi:hypothetical protein H0E87_012709 [Populus deltoides]|uniref:AP2/ERF domain-containing protein n=1 Tax=Populus deltoides TaxID=3696 RepID=A0A8T2YKG6_POPDE|nr:hypothetical protein H0E87_012709 [Populus deltoides]
MMLDLNLSAVSGDSSTTGKNNKRKQKKILELSNSPLESSGSFDSSSIVNADGCGDEDSCSNGDLFAYNFSILSNEISVKKTVDCDNNNDDGDDSGDRTIQLFPVACGIKNVGGESQSSSTMQMQWSGVGECRDQGSPSEHGIVAQQKPVKKSRRGPRSRSSQYRGVTFYRRTGRWESHIWGFDTAHAAARVYDRAAIKFRGVDADINFNVTDYDEDVKQMRNFTKEEFVHILRRQSTGFSRGSSKYRGVTLHKCGRWEARMGQFLGKNIHCLPAGTFILGYSIARQKLQGLMTRLPLNAMEGKQLPTLSQARMKERYFLSLTMETANKNLDLNLGIAPPDTSDGLKANSNMGGFYFQSDWDGLSTDRAPKILNSASATMKNQQPNGPGMTSVHLPTWDGVNHHIFPIYEERAIEKRMEVDSFPNWTRQIQGPYGGGANPLPLFSTAASSGFASSAIMAPSAAAGQLQFPSSTILHRFPPFTNPSNISQFYCRS